MADILSFHWLGYDYGFTVELEETNSYNRYNVDFIRDMSPLHEHIKLPLFYTTEGDIIRWPTHFTETGKDILKEIWTEIENRYNLPPSKFEGDGFGPQ